MSGCITREAFEDLAGCVKEIFNVHTVQLGSGHFRGRLDFIAGKGMLLYRENYPIRTHLQGELLGNRFGLSIPLRSEYGRFLGEPVDDTRTASSVSGESFDYMMEAGFEQMILLIDHGKLLKLAEQAALSSAALEALLKGRKGKVLNTNAHAVARTRKTFSRMLHSVRQGTMNMSADDFEKVIFETLLPVIDGGHYHLDRNSAIVTVRRSMDCACAINGPIRISDLCMALNISPRTLELAFRMVMGMTPHVFFRKRRLNMAYMELMRADPRESRVTDIALSLGFSELGRFSVQYRELFGESPSETLRRSRSCAVTVPAW
jgi:AraC-like DNA-binding protein